MMGAGLKREITKIHLLFISFAAIFGSGWLFAPLYSAQVAGPAALLAWVIGGIMSAVIGLTMAEVITLFPKAGGLNYATAKTHGEFLGMWVNILNLIVFLILPALEVRAIIQYLSSAFPSLLIEGGNLGVPGFLVAVLMLGLIFLLNFNGPKLTSWMNTGLVVFKLITPLVIGFMFLNELSATQRLNHNNLTGFFPIQWKEVFQAIATCGIIFSFNGFNQATVFAGEARNPSRSIPFAILGSLVLSGILYFFIQYVFLVSVPAENIAHGWKGLTFPGDQGPFAGLAKMMGLASLLTLVYADAVISPAGTAYSYASAAPRLFYSLSEAIGVFPVLRRVRANGAPYVAMALSVVIELLVLFFLPSLKAMISILVAAFVLCYTVTPASLLALRKLDPGLERPFKIRPAWLLCFLSVFFSNLMVLSTGWVPLRNLTLISLVLVTIMIFGLSRKRSLVDLVKGSGWFVFQLGGLVALAYLHQAEKMGFLAMTGAAAGLSLGVLLVSQTSLIQRSH